jgi:type I restriction enzyme S subunit
LGRDHTRYIAEFKNGLNFTKGSKGERIRIVGVKDFQSNFWVPTEGLDSVHIDGGLSEAYLLRKDDILTVRSNGNKQLIGRCILASDVREKTSHSGFTIRIRITRGDVNPVYLVRYLKSGAARKALIESGDGAQISNLNQQALTALPVKLLKPRSQHDVVRRLSEIEAESDRLEAWYEQRIGHLAELKQAILRNAFSGEITSPPSTAIQEAAE